MKTKAQIYLRLHVKAQHGGKLKIKSSNIVPGYFVSAQSGKFVKRKSICTSIDSILLHQRQFEAKQTHFRHYF